MRRVVLGPNDSFSASLINRTGAFNPQAMVAATDII